MIAWIVLAVVVAGAAFAAGRRLGATRERARAGAELDRTRGELAQKLDEIYSLQELSFVLSGSLKPDRIASRIAEYVSRFFPVDGALVALVSEGAQRIHIAAARGSLESLAGRVIAEDAGGLLVQAMGSEQLELAEREGDAAPMIVSGAPVERAAVLPLRAHGVTVGALAVVNLFDNPFSGEHLRLLSTVATHAAIVLSNARFIDLVRSARDQWETTVDSLAEGLAVVDESGLVRRANRALANLLNTPVSALTGTHFAESLVGGSEELTSLLDAARAGERSPPVTFRSEPLARVLRITVAPMSGEEDSTWVVALVEDVTEEQALEAQLIQNEKMAAVGQLVSGVAHELNNPLTSIAGLTEFLLERSTGSDPNHDHLKVIHEQAERAGRIVRNLLTFAHKGPAEVGPLDLNEIVFRTISLMGYELKLRDIQLHTALNANLPEIQGDRYQMQQVVLNLVTNAVQAVADNPSDRPRRIEISSDFQGGDVVLRVADSGPGIPEEVRADIFTPFFTTKAPGEGTGLGLSITFRIVQGHGGTLSVQPETTGGAVFEVRLPIYPTEERRQPGGVDAMRRPAPAETVNTPAPARREILLVDDDPAVRRMISVLLEGETVTVEAAENAGHAVRLLEKRDFDLIIADPRAAVSAGERFADHVLRRWPRISDRTILLTADVRPETDAWLQELGCRYFVKPFRMEDLKAAAAEIFAQQPGRT